MCGWCYNFEHSIDMVNGASLVKHIRQLTVAQCGWLGFISPSDAPPFSSPVQPLLVYDVITHPYECQAYVCNTIAAFCQLPSEYIEPYVALSTNISDANAYNTRPSI